MKTNNDFFTEAVQSKALKILKNRLLDEFNIEEMILYGSVVRSEADNESDADLLILTNQPMSRFERHKITDVVFEVNLTYGTNFSSLVIDRALWESGPVSILPIHEEIQRDGIIL